MLDNQFDIVKYKQFLVKLESSDDLVFQEYSKKIQAALAEFESQELIALKAHLIQKWKRNLGVYSESSDVAVSEFALLIDSQFTKLIAEQITLEEFLESTSKEPSETVLDINSLLYIRENIVKIFD
jgi:hypothetical protein